MLVRAILALTLAPAPADDLDDARALLATGEYRACVEAADAGIVDAFDTEPWHVLKLRALRRLGDCEAIAVAADIALDECPRDVSVHIEAHLALRDCGQSERADEILVEAESMGRRYSYRYRDADDQVVLGRIALLRNADAKHVLDTYLTPAKQDEPDLVDPHAAIAELALDKHDYGLAAEGARAAIAISPADPDLHLLLARALASSDGAGTAAALDRALELDPSHAGALAMSVDGRVAADERDEARALLDIVHGTDPGHPEAWAWRAVLAHLEGDADGERDARAKALERWEQNPEVDHLIGRELSEKYRFAEGAEAQRRALNRDADHVGARFQLAQDLLRLGDEEEGWQLAEGVLDDDPYHVVAYNLMVLHDLLVEYTTLERDGLIVRMEAGEAAVYGERVLELLTEARDHLSERYRITFDGPVTLELFEEQKDFAIRTFGLPGGEGFLGVCFGDVITMKSPVTQGEDPSNWEAVLWHEFCHAVTLHKTKNRMPRWLSEGISVWEERLRDPSWGQTMRPAYRDIILAGGATPLDRLGSAFREPDGPLGLQFAYYESSLAVEFLVERLGFDTLLGLLDDLAGTRTVATSLAERAAPMDELVAEFDEWLVERAEAWGEGATWEALPDEGDAASLLAFVDAHPRNPAARLSCAAALVGEDRADEATAHLERAIELCPELLGPGNAYEQLASLHRGAGDVEAELGALDRWLAVECDALPARLRRMELRAEREEWPAALEASRAVLAVQPMLSAAHRIRGRAARQLAQYEELLSAGRSLLALDPVDPARVHFQIAEAAHALGDAATAKRQVLMALEEAPRFREAHELLLELADEGEDGGR